MGSNSVYLSDMVYEVIIVGAGIAGLSAAKHLYTNGVKDILVLEAKSRPGGRIETVPIKSNKGNVCGRAEMGAQWIHGEENDLCREVKRWSHLHTETSWEGKGDFLLADGSQASPLLVTQVLDWLEDTISYAEETFCIEKFQSNPSHFASDSTYSSMGHFLRARFAQYLRDNAVHEGSEEHHLRSAIFQWGLSFQRIDNSCNHMTNLSLHRWPEFVVCPGEHYNNFKHGASAFLENVMIGKYLPSDVIMCNSPVANISWGDGGGNNGVKVQVRLRNGYLLQAQSVIVTCSIGVLKAEMASLFTPKLPTSLQSAIKATGFGPIAKIFLEWETPWWPKDTKGFQLLWPKEFIDCCDDDDTDRSLSHKRWPRSITGFDPIIESPTTLLGWLGGPEAKYVETLEEAFVGEECTRLLRQFSGIQNIPSPRNVLVTKWNSDEFVRGAYCFRAVEGDSTPGDIVDVLSTPVYASDSNNCKPVPVLLLAGEALSKTHYSTLHGAYESGESQAAKLVQYFQEQKKLVQKNGSFNKATTTAHISKLAAAPNDSNNTEIQSSIICGKLHEIGVNSDLGQITTELKLVCQF